jgi:3'-phosphoadenosine 5'-phosphosulfate sulfotransferase (PAPS reductase)/FAD synthetase
LEWYEYFNGNVYVSFSGGKDSTVLLHLVRQLYHDVEAVFCDTGLEYPELKQFVKSQKNVNIIKPKMCFKDVISKYGYPVISKETSEKIYKMKNYNLSDRLKNYFLNGDERGKMGMIPKKWQFLIDEDVKIGSQCCDIMKKRPFKQYEKISGNKPIIGSMAHESRLRETTYLKQGCNSFDSKKQVSNPLGFWTEQDILEYIHRYNISIPSVYGKLYKENGEYKLSGVQRTGCIFCLFGIHLEKYPNRIQKLELSHPKLYDYCIQNLKLNKSTL